MIRRADATELASVNALVQRVVNDTYAGQWKPGPIDIGDNDWSRAHVAVVDDTIAGVVATEADWVTNLWVDHAFRRRGIGRALLAAAEHELVEADIAVASLRVVSTNVRAIAFYDAMGWLRTREVMREGIPVPMIVYTKQLGGDE
jgi:ribosomal protein S18 acetylase RimI-like enzyme